MKIWQAAARLWPAVSIFLSVGALTGAWAASGTVAMLIAIGLDWLSGPFFLVQAALLAALLAFATGTSWGAVGTAGVALMGVARGLGVPLPEAAGAIVAGAHFGDKMSPLSETAALSSTIAGTTLYTHIRHLVYTTLPAFLVALGVYAALGGAAEGVAGDAAATQAFGPALTSALAQAFVLHPALLLPPAIVLAAAVLRAPAVPSMWLSTAAALVLAVWLQPLRAAEVPGLLLWGFRPATGDPAADQLLRQGGILTMAGPAALAVALFAAVHILLGLPRVRQRLQTWTARIRTRGQLVLSTVLVTMATLFGSGGATYLAIVLPGDLFAPLYQRLRLAPQNLSRTLEDAGTVVAPLVPWGVAGVFISSTLGVPTWDYIPYAVMNYFGFVFAILFGYTGWFLPPLDGIPSANPRK